MSKVLGWIVSTVILVWVAYTYLFPSQLEMIVDWLGPVLGFNLRIGLTCFYLTFYDVFKDFRLLVLWFLSMFIGGFIGRSGKTGVGLAFSTYATLTVAIGLGFLPVGMGLGEISSFTIPPIPPTFSPNSLTQIPVVGKLLYSLTKTQNLIGQFNLQTILSLIKPLTLDLVKSVAKTLVLACVAGFIGGMVGGKIWRRV